MNHIEEDVRRVWERLPEDVRELLDDRLASLEPDKAQVGESIKGLVVRTCNEVFDVSGDVEPLVLYEPLYSAIGNFARGHAGDKVLGPVYRDIKESFDRLNGLVYYGPISGFCSPPDLKEYLDHHPGVEGRYRTHYTEGEERRREEHPYLWIGVPKRSVHGFYYDVDKLDVIIDCETWVSREGSNLVDYVCVSVKPLKPEGKENVGKVVDILRKAKDYVAKTDRY